jgi:hypothetical protein
MFGAGSGFGSARERMERATGPRQKSGPVHYPYVRPLQLDWQELPTGFRAGRNDPYRFEVICAACGDIDGPLEYQPSAAQQLRGPYEAKRIAEKISQRHHVGSTFAVSRDSGGKWEQLKYMLPMRTTPKRSPLGPRAIDSAIGGARDRSTPNRSPLGPRTLGEARDRSTTWHQVLWVRLQARWIRWRK